MKICVVGPGAMGCLFAGFLASSGEEVVILDKHHERAEKIRGEGIRIEGVSGERTVQIDATADAHKIGKCDLAILTVKSYDTETATRSARPLADTKTYFLTLQNGIGNLEIIGDIVGKDRVIGGVTSQGATLLADGHIRHAGVGDTVIGRVDGKITQDLNEIAEIFTKAGLPTKSSDNVIGLLWSKLIINVGINALTAITRLNNGRLIEFDGTHRILKGAVNEALLVAKKKKIKLIYDDPIKKTEEVCAATAKNVSSMLQDVLKRKRTEIDYINGAIVREAELLKMDVPVNSVLTDLVHTIEQSYDLQVPSPFPSPQRGEVR